MTIDSILAWKTAADLSSILNKSPAAVLLEGDVVVNGVLQQDGFSGNAQDIKPRSSVIVKHHGKTYQVKKFANGRIEVYG